MFQTNTVSSYCSYGIHTSQVFTQDYTAAVVTKYDLFLNHVPRDNSCAIYNQCEDAEHNLFRCPKYFLERRHFLIL